MQTHCFLIDDQLAVSLERLVKAAKGISKEYSADRQQKCHNTEKSHYFNTDCVRFVRNLVVKHASLPSCYDTKEEINQNSNPIKRLVSRFTTDAFLSNQLCIPIFHIEVLVLLGFLGGNYIWDLN